MRALTKHPVVERIEAEVERTLADFGYELVQIKFGGPPSNQTLSIYIDKPGGVTSSDCQYMTERLSVLLDLLDPIQGRYNLLVSSPGINRPLTKDEDFTRFAGMRAAVTYRNAEGNRATLRGKLVGIEEDRVVLEAGEQPQSLRLEDVEQAHLVYEWEDEKGE